MELTLKYYHYFDNEKDELGENLNRPESWDVLRIKGSGINSPFYIPEERDVWVRKCLDDKALVLRAKKIAEFLKTDFERIHSFGVGGAYLEFLIKKENPSFRLSCSDFTPQGIDRLKRVFVEADEISNFDMIHGDWSAVTSKSVCLFYRVDTVFDDEQWKKVFNKMKCAGITDVLFVPCGILTFRKILYQQFKYIIFKLLRRKMTFSGFVRTKRRFVSLLSEYYEIAQVVNIEDLTGFQLKLRTEDK